MKSGSPTQRLKEYMCPSIGYFKTGSHCVEMSNARFRACIPILLGRQKLSDANSHNARKSNGLPKNHRHRIGVERLFRGQ